MLIFGIMMIHQKFNNVFTVVGGLSVVIGYWFWRYLSLNPEQKKQELKWLALKAVLTIILVLLVRYFYY